MIAQFDKQLESALYFAGYKRWKNGFVRWTGKGTRFHAFILGDNYLDLHYDKTYFGFHKSFDINHQLKNEIKRIRNN
jgi:hypothetical protein